MDRRPVSIAIEGDLALGQQYIPQAQQLLFTLRAQMEPGGITTSRAYMDLPDGAYAYAISAMGIDAIRIVVANGGASGQIYEIPPKREPDFVSGISIDGRITGTPNGVGQVMQSFIPTAATGRLHGLQAGNAAPIKRLAVELGAAFAAVDGLAQCGVLKPTMYSGSMKEVIQSLLGFGRQNAVSIYEAQNKKQFTSVEAEALNAPINQPTQYESSVAANGLQVLYDYRFYRTHGITWAADGKPWLVEISTNKGVIAMPLPLHDSTTSVKFREKLMVMGDEDGIRLLDRFGGFPTGEGFPIGVEALASAVRAGIVLQMLPNENIQPFYRHSAYSSAMGWAFNERGSEAHNTGYRYGDDGIQRGVHYSVSLQIGATTAPPVNVSLAEPARLKVIEAIIEMVRALAGTLGLKATILVKKARRLNREQAEDVMRTARQQGQNYGAAALDTLTLLPIATGNASLSLSAEGKIHWPRIQSPQIKFHEPLLGYLLSHDMRPAEPCPSVDCDTTMHVFFKGNELKVCKFFHRANQKVANRYESDEEECMYVGAWTITQETDRRVPSMFYTTDFDDREEIGGGSRVTRTVGRDLGYTSCQYGDDPGNLREGAMSRTKTFRMFSTVKVREGVIRKAAIAVPNGIREAYYYAVMDTVDSKTDAEMLRYKTLGDPYVYHTWRNVDTTGQPHPAGCGPVSKRTVWYEEYMEEPCSDLANAGPWSKPCDDAESMRYTVNLPPTYDKATVINNQTKLVVHLECCSERTPLMTKTIEKNDPYFQGGFWFIPSPDPVTGLTAFIAATHNALGDGDALKYNPNINDSKSVVVGVPNYSQMVTKPINFIGVINGV